MAERRVQCSVCGGSGKYAYNDVSPCYGCNGHGYIIEQYDDSSSSSSSSSYTPSSSGGGGSSRQQEPDKGTLIWREGEQLLKAGNYDKAILKFTQSINAGGINKSNAYLSRGYCYDQKGNYDQAIDDYTEALNIGFPYNIKVKATTECYFNRGNMHNKKGETDQAIADWKKAADLGDNDALTSLANKGIQYTPQKPQSSSSSSSYSSSSYSDEPRSIGSKLLGILFGIIGAVVLLAIVMILLSILDNPILNLLGLLGSPVAGFILGYKLSRSLAAKLIILALLIGGGIFVWYNLSLLGPFSGKAQTVSETAATATVNANVNFRKEPTTGDNIIRQLQQGDTVTLTGETNGGWTQIKHGNDTGWISTEYLKK